MMEPLFS